jgi:hypothetical protein
MPQGLSPDFSGSAETQGLALGYLKAKATARARAEAKAR